MEQVRENLKQANELITESIKELEENNPTELLAIETLKEDRIEIGWIIQEIDISSSD